MNELLQLFFFSEVHIYVTSNLEWKGLGKKLYLGFPPPHTFKTKKYEEKIKLNLIAMPF